MTEDSKTPEQMAEEWYWDNLTEQSPVVMLTNPIKHPPCPRKAFLAGYKAAKETYKDAISVYEDVAKQMLEKAIRILSPKDQFADADKVMCNTTMKEIKAVDTGELMPITNLPTQAKWISVKERLPEHFEDVLTFEDGECYRVNSISQLTKYWWDSDEGFERNPSHWMPLPEPPKDAKE